MSNDHFIRQSFCSKPMQTRQFNILVLLVGFLMDSSETFSFSSRLYFTKPSENRIEIHLENDHGVAALQFTLNALGGVNIQAVSLSGRMSDEDWALSSFKLNDSTLNVIVIRKGRYGLLGGDGAIAEVIVGISDANAMHSISFSRVVASTPMAVLIDLDLETLEWTPSVTQPFTLNQNYPNPFNPSTTIPFTLSRAARVSLTVYDLAGRQIRKIFEGLLGPGTYSATWNSTDESGTLVPSGIYFVRLTAEDLSFVWKMIVTR